MIRLSSLAPFTLAVLLAAGATSPQAPAHAQGLLGFSNGDGGEDLEIEADEGIEWRRDEQVYIAFGNASATRGQGTVYGDRLVAHYREVDSADAEQSDGGMLGGGRTQIYRVEAIGNVRLVGQDGTAYGDHSVYDVDREVVILTGDNLRLETAEDVVTARDQMEYWPERNVAVARGDALAVSGERQIRAEVLSAHFMESGEDGGETPEGGRDGQRLSHIEAFENVRITTAEEYARGDRGIYDARTEIAELFGEVRLTRGDNQLNGGYAEVNLQTGISRLLASAPGEDARERVRGLLRPERAGEGEANADGGSVNAGGE